MPGAGLIVQLERPPLAAVQLDGYARASLHCRGGGKSPATSPLEWDAPTIVSKVTKASVLMPEVAGSPSTGANHRGGLLLGYAAVGEEGLRAGVSRLAAGPSNSYQPILGGARARQPLHESATIGPGGVSIYSGRGVVR